MARVPRRSRLHLVLVGAIACSSAPREGSSPTPTQSGSPPIGLGSVASVGNVAITREQFDALYRAQAAAIAAQGKQLDAAVDAELRKRVLARLVYESVLSQESAKLGIRHDPADAKRIVEAERASVPDWPAELARRGETDRSFEAAVVATLREQVILGELGRTEDARGQLADELLRKYLVTITTE